MNWKHQAIRHSRKQMHLLLLSSLPDREPEMVVRRARWIPRKRSRWVGIGTNRRKSNQHPAFVENRSREICSRVYPLNFFLLISRKVHPTSFRHPTASWILSHTMPTHRKRYHSNRVMGVQTSGVGWHWSHTSELTISNRVTTVIKKVYLESATKPQ